MTGKQQKKNPNGLTAEEAARYPQIERTMFYGREGLEWIRDNIDALLQGEAESLRLPFHDKQGREVVYELVYRPEIDERGKIVSKPAYMKDPKGIGK